MSKFTPGKVKPANSGIKKGQKQTRTLVKRQVYDLLEMSGRHPVTELMKLLPELSPKDASRVWLELLQYISPKLSAQAVTIDDGRDQNKEDVIDVTPLTTDELIKNAQGEE